MKKAFIAGLGLCLGWEAGKVIRELFILGAEKLLYKYANDDPYMAALKIRNPILHKRVLKYRKYE